MTSFLAKISNGGLDFGSEYNNARFNDFLKKSDGKKIKISLEDNPVSESMRGYMFGALIPFLRQIDGNAWAALTDEQVYEVLKKNFNYFLAFNPLTKRQERYGQSVMNVSCKNKKAMEFINRIGDWVRENYGQELPDPAEYKSFRDSAPLKNDTSN